MEINVGDYVRTKDGTIAKIIEMSGYKTLLDRYYFSSCEGNMDNDLFDEDIIKHSKDIIDIIEVGDYVNGKNVHKIDIKENHIAWYLYDENNNIFAGKDSDGLQWKIKSILTYEQYIQNAYTIEKER